MTKIPTTIPVIITTIPIIIPTTIPNIPPTTIPNIPPTTIPSIPPTTIPNIPPTTILNIPPTTIPNIPPTTIPNIPSPPTTIIKEVHPTTIPLFPQTTIIKETPTTIPLIIPPTTQPIIPTTIPKLIPTTILSTLPIIITPTDYEDKCLNGTLINEQCKNLTDEEIYDKIKEEVLDKYATNPENTIYKGKDYALQVSKTHSNLPFDNSNNIPLIDLGDCETLLKQANNIPLEESLIIIEIEKTSESDTDANTGKNFQFDVYNPITRQKLDISICYNTTIDMYVPLVMSEEQEDIYKDLLDQGYDPFDLNDKFYREICTPYTSGNGTDVLLDDREEYVFSTVINESACMGNCQYTSYSLDSKYVKCECEVNSTYVTLDVKHLSGENIYLSFLSALKSTNYKVMRCYNLVFNFKIFCHNYGSIITLIFFIVYVIFIVYYSFKDISPLRVDISKILFKESEKLNKLEKVEYSKIQKESMLKLKPKAKSKKKSIKGHNPPRKNKKVKLNTDLTEKRKNTEDLELIQFSKSNKRKSKNQGPKFGRRSSKLGKSLKENVYDIQDVEPNDYNSEYHPKENIINVKKKARENLEKQRHLDNFELNNLDYDDACELDHRGFCKTYWSVLMREHLVLFTFFTCYDYNLFYIKIERFLILICTQMTVNGLFFIHESMHRKNTGQGLTFVEKIPQLLFTLISSHIIEVILCFLSMTDTHIYEIKALPVEQKKNGEQVLNIIDRMRRRLTTFFIFTFLLFLFYWYFISAFCAVYQNTQEIFLRDSGISILTSFIDPFIIYGLTSVIRIISLCLCCKKKLCCLYKLSDIIPIF